MDVVWFKRDLRVYDHRPLMEAVSQAGADGVCCLYVYEPSLLNSAEWDRSHSRFVDECLEQVDRDLRSSGGRMTYRVGEVVQVLQALHREKTIRRMWSHEETGNAITYRRDLAVAEWCQTVGIVWREFPQHGVIRRLGSRDGWGGRWAKRMSETMVPVPGLMRAADVDVGDRRTPEDLVQKNSTVESELRGGTDQGEDVLHGFLTQRGQKYQTEMSSPVTAAAACSRISPYLTFGALSMRSVFQQVEAAKLTLKGQRGEEARQWRASYSSFGKRLRWHCHFMQKLEDEPDIEFHNMNRGFDGLRENEFCEKRFEAWKRGETGYPLVDACMRSVTKTGWLTFRMRAMVVSFASYHLWLHWRPTALWLGQHFLDFEPGIHFSQFQMQSGVTGINTLRIYSPIKQVVDQDPNGEFIRTWVPELADVPNEYLSEPWTMPPLLQQMQGLVIGKQYPEPIVDHKSATRAARENIFARKRSPDVRAISAEVLEKHGSRKGG